MKFATHALTVSLIVLAITTMQVSTVMADPKEVSTPATQPTSQAVVSVKIENFAFLPRELHIDVGTTVTWQNADDVPHTATSKDDPQIFDSGALDTDDKFSFTFSKPGKYAY